MKAPYRYLIGIAVGTAAGFILKGNEAAADYINQAAVFTLAAGRYILFPLFFFSLPVAVTRLRRVKKLGRVLKLSLIYLLIASAVLTLAGTLGGWLSGFGRLPVIPSARPEVNTISFSSILSQIIQPDLFNVFIINPSFLLPLFVPAFLLGWHFYFDREIAEPAFNFFDSLSRILYRINSYILVLMPFMLAVLAASSTVNALSVVDFKRFVPLLLILAFAAMFTAAAVYPFILWLSGHKKHMFKYLAAVSGALIGAAASGSTLFNYGNFTRHIKENLKIPRESGALLTPLLVMFSRAGTAFILAVSMLAVQKSYSSLEITLFQAAWTALFAFLLSFALPSFPGSGISTALVLITGFYGRGLEEGWLILVPVIPFLSMIAAFLDTATHALILYIVTDKSELERDNKEPVISF